MNIILYSLNTHPVEYCKEGKKTKLAFTMAGKSFLVPVSLSSIDPSILSISGKGLGTGIQK
jgi:hypothetical protein